MEMPGVNQRGRELFLEKTAFTFTQTFLVTLKVRPEGVA